MRFFAFALFLVGCGGEGAISLDDYSAALRDARCRYYVRCGQIRTAADCATLNFGPVAISDRLRWAVREQHIRWNGEAAYACVQRANEASCDRADEDDWRCDAPLYDGLLGDGEECSSSVECISKECWQGTAGLCRDKCCAGHCVGASPPVDGRIGDPCRFSGCIEGRCNGNICVARLADGSQCSVDDECQIGSWCRAGITDARHCARLPDSGETCEGRCRRVGDACSPASRRCEPYRLRGDSCLIDATCSPFYACDSGRCTAYELHDGELCYWEGRRCTDDGSYCDISGVCTAPSLPPECSEL